MEQIQHAHPLGVTLGQIVVHGHHMHTLAGQCIQINRQRGHQGFTLTGRHLRNLALMQHRTANQLNIVMAHVPSDFVSSCHPMVLVHSLVTLNRNTVEFCRQVTVKIVCSHPNLSIFLKTLGSLLHDGKSLRKQLIQNIFRHLINGILLLLNALVQFLFLFNRHIIFRLQTIVHGLDFSLFLPDDLLYPLFKLHCFGTQLIVGKLGNAAVCRPYLLQNRPEFLHILIGLRTEKFL